jgi:hypothetical protein
MPTVTSSASASLGERDDREDQCRGPVLGEHERPGPAARPTKWTCARASMAAAPGATPRDPYGDDVPAHHHLRLRHGTGRHQRRRLLRPACVHVPQPQPRRSALLEMSRRGGGRGEGERRHLRCPRQARGEPHHRGAQDGFVNGTLELNGDLTNGLYLVSVTAGAATFNERLVIQK